MLSAESETKLCALLFSIDESLEQLVGLCYAHGRLPGRRERIATAALTGYLAMYAGASSSLDCPKPRDAAVNALEYADTLIAALDAKETPCPH